MAWFHALLKHTPEIALFLALAAGYGVGRLAIGNWRLGGVAGSMLAGLVIGQTGVQIHPGVLLVMFSIFVYALGYESGPQFVNAFRRTGLREVALALFMAVAGVLIVVALARLFGLDKGLAAGVAAGGMTQAAIIGTAGDAIVRSGMGPGTMRLLQAHVAIGYAITYAFGSLGGILVCAWLLPRFFGASLRDEALRAEHAMQGGRTVPAGQGSALPPLVGRLFRVGPATGKSVAELEMSGRDQVTIEQVQRDGRALALKPDLVLSAADIVLIVGRRNAMVSLTAQLGEELADAEGMDVVMQSRRVVFTHARMNNQTVSGIVAMVDREMRHGVYLEGIERNGQDVPPLPELRLQHGDILTLYGTPEDTLRAAKVAGYELVTSEKTDFIYFGTGVLAGLLLGVLSARIGDGAFGLGATGGALVSGLVFGWARARHPMYGAMPTAASRLLRDFGLASFAAVIGLNAGPLAGGVLAAHWLAIVACGALVAVVPLLLAMLFGRYVLRYDNAALLAGALAGARCANPAFRAVLDQAGSPAPAVPFASAYALSSVLLTLMGPFVVGLL